MDGKLETGILINWKFYIIKFEIKKNKSETLNLIWSAWSNKGTYTSNKQFSCCHNCSVENVKNNNTIKVSRIILKLIKINLSKLNIVCRI